MPIASVVFLDRDEGPGRPLLSWHPARTAHTRQRQVVDTLALLVKEQFKLNQPNGPSDGWLTQDSLWLVSKTVTDKLRAALLSTGIEGIPSSNPTMFNLLQDQGIILANAKGKAVWDITVEIGVWKQKLSCLKLAPSLIWAAGTERPEPFQGRITVKDQPALQEDGAAASPPASEPTALPAQPPAPPVPQTAPTPPKATPAAMPAASAEPAGSPTGDDIGDLLALMGMDTDIPFDTPAMAESAAGQTEPALETIQPPVAAAPEPLLPAQPAMPVPPAAQPAVSPPLPPETSAGPANTGSAETEIQSLGQQFITWLRDGILSRKLIINEATAKVHTLGGTAFLVTPGIFQRFAQEHPELEPVARAQKLHSWELVQRAFGKEGLHRKRDDGLNIWTAKVTGPRKTSQLKGYLLNDPRIVFSEVPYDNPYLKLQAG